MGAAVSKSTEDIKDDTSESSVRSAPMLTPQIRRLDWDPRSPSSDIARTPIEVLKTPITSGAATPTNNTLNVTEDLNDDNVHNTHDHLNTLDPRSPTTEFHRTPIITEAVLKSQKLHNKNLDNVRAPLVVVTPIKPKKLSERVVKKIYGTPEVDSTKLVSPKLLESSPITVKPPENKRHSLVGLLETNIDFVETDLDKVYLSKIENIIEVPAHTLSPPLETSKSSILSPEDNIWETCDLDSVHKINDSDLESDSEISNIIETVIPHTKEACLFNMKTDDELTEIMQDVYKISAEVDIKSGGSIVNELDRKLTNLIYEDKQSEVSPKPSKLIDNNHTPLRDRNINSQQPKSIPKLKVSDKPTKPLGGVSRIPVFKEKKLKGKINVQCENTPPRMKPKRSQWDPEDSLII